MTWAPVSATTTWTGTRRLRRLPWRLLAPPSACGEISPEARHLIEVTEQSFWKGFEQAKSGNRCMTFPARPDLCGIQRLQPGPGGTPATASAIRSTRTPRSPNYVPESGRNERLIPQYGHLRGTHGERRNGGHPEQVDAGRWAVPMTADHKLAAHYENTILITEAGPEILTRCDED